MARVQVTLPDELYAFLESSGLSVDELLRTAVETELRRHEAQVAGEAYLDQLEAEVGEPSAEVYAKARASADRIERHMRRSHQDTTRKAS